MDESKDITKNDAKIIEKLNEMKLRGFTQKTIKAYTYHYNRFKKSNKTRDEYIRWMIEKGYATASTRLASTAIQFFTGKEPNVFIPKKEKKLPHVLSKTEINKMISSLPSIKHRLVISLLYSSGMRLSELINLKHTDINFVRNIIHLKEAKGRKDRITLLSKKVKKMLRETNFGNIYVFENNGKKYSSKSVYEIVKKSAKRAGITTNVHPHILRHSFATHLLESGTDIRYIQKLLGHARLETTSIYTYVANEHLKIRSPLD
ncbi:MAG: tyrosine-type recombinase/integrase [Nanoarchaeota archaeon]